MVLKWCKYEISEIKRINYSPPVKRIYWATFLENENEHWLGLIRHLCLCHMCTKTKFGSLVQRVIPLNHIQVLLGSLPNISCAAIKPHFTAFHTIISDECYLEPSLRSASTLQKATLSSFGKSQTVNSFWWSVCGVQSASVSPFTRGLFDEEKTIWA